MSIRDNDEEYTRVRGTMISTNSWRPSKLPVSVIQSFGLPNRNGQVFVDSHVIHLKYDTHDDKLVTAWAVPPPTRPTPHSRTNDDWGCSVS